MEKYGKETRNLPGNFLSVLQIIHGIDSYSAISK